MTIIRYEIKKKKNELFVLLLGLLPFVLMYLVMLRFPDLILRAAVWVNRRRIVLDFLGIQSRIESITYKDTMMAVLTVMSVLLLYWLIAETSRSVAREKRLGTLEYFLSQPVSRTRLLLVKLGISTGIFVLQMLLWWFAIWRFSIHGAEHIPFFYEMITEDVADVVLALACVGFLALSAGFFHGCILNRRNGKKGSFFAFHVVLICCMAAILPNILNIGMRALERGKNQSAAFEKMTEIFHKLQEWNPVYRCNPWAVIENGWDWRMTVGCILTGALFVALGIFIYQRKEMEAY